jgi:phage terminase large subunit
MIIDLQKNADKLFTKVFYKVRAAFLLAVRFVINYGGAGSSKSVSQHQSELINLLKGCDYDILFMRKVAADIYDSSYKLFQQIATSWGVYDQFIWNYSNEKRQIQNKITGHRIVFRGADDISKLKSIVGIGRIVLEEADQFDFDDFKEINRRARGFKNIQIVFLLNPIDEEHWINLYFVSKPDGKPAQAGKPPIGAYYDRCHFIHSTYQDNQFLDEDFIKELLLLKEVDENEYNIYALGKWGRIKTGAEFYPQFKEFIHGGRFPFVPGQTVHLSYDFNVMPYMTLLCIQYLQDEEYIRFRVFKEYCLASPFNTTTAVTEAFLDDYESKIGSVFYYGDASGNNRIAGKGDEVNYDDVRASLVRYIYEGSDRTSSYNKPVLKRRKLVMMALAGQLYLGKRKIIIEVDHSCKEMIRDFKYLKLGQNGKLKEVIKNSKTKVSYQEFGHTSDAFEYCFCEIFEALM